MGCSPKGWRDKLRWGSSSTPCPALLFRGGGLAMVVEISYKNAR